MRWILPLTACLLVAAWFLDDAGGTAIDGVEPAETAPAGAPERPLLVGRPETAAEVASVEPETTDEVVEDVEVSGENPPDPIETGPCLLIVATYDEDTREILDTQLDLWRIDAPGNEGWTRGDQRQARVTTEDGLVRIDDLPEGRYRVHAHGQRKGTEDLPAFEVSGPLTEVRLDLPGLREHRVYLQVFDERGNRITAGRLSRDGDGGGSSRSRRPVWVSTRTRRDGRPAGCSFGGSGFLSCGMHRGGPRVVADGKGFDLGLHREDRRYDRRYARYELLVDGRTPAYVRVENDVHRERTYQGLSLPLAYVHDRVFLPSGERAAAAGAFFYVRTEAKVETDETPRDAWRHLTVELSVSLDGYADLELEFTLADDDWTATLEPKTPAESDEQRIPGRSP